MAGKPAALVLAGKRDGSLDPLAAAHGVTHKCLVPIGGAPLIDHVLRALEAADVGQIAVSIDDAALLDALPVVQRLRAAGRYVTIASAAYLVDSVHAATAVTGFPLAITTADNVLLTPDSIATVVGRVGLTRADALVAFATEADVKDAHPDGQRRFYRFRDDAYSNSNLFWLGSARALAAAEAFRQGGQFAKQPRRIVKAFGLFNLLRFRYRLATLDQLMTAIGRRYRLRLVACILPDGASAIDVDNERTYNVAAELLARRP